MDDQGLVLGCLRGDQSSWNAFVDRFAKLIHWSIRQTLENSSFKGRGDLCEDIFQDFFKKLIERDELTKLKELENLRKFLSVSAMHLTLDRMKGLRRYEKSSDHEVTALLEDSGKDARERETIFLVQEVVEDLDEVERACLELHYYEDKSHREIGEQLGLPQDTVSTHIRRSREKLKQRLIEKGMDENDR